MVIISHRRLHLLWQSIACLCGLWLADHSLAAQTVVWSGASATNSANTNWSSAGNWSGGMPGPATNLCFFDAGAVASPGVVDNIVDASTTVFSLQYGNTNNNHTTLINPGVTLTVTNPGALNLVFVGTATDNGSGQTVTATITGAGGRLVVSGTNSGSAMVVQQGSANSGTHLATLNLAGLDTFNLTAGLLLLGGSPGSTGASNWCSGTLLLAKTNLIQLNGAAPALNAGDAYNNGGTESLQLGQSNAVYADTLTIARSKATATLQFNPVFSNNPVLWLRGVSAPAVATLAVGDFSAQSTSSSTTLGTLNVSGGTVNALVNTAYVARGQTGSGTGPCTGNLILGNGIFKVDVLNVGYLGATTAAGTVNGTVTVTNGTLAVKTNLLLAYNPGATASVTGTLNLTNATLLASTITAGGGTGKINLSGGLLVVSNALATPAAPLTSLSVNAGAILQFWVQNNWTNAAVTSLTSDHSGQLSIASLPLILAYPTTFPLISCPHGGASGIPFTLASLPGLYQGYISNDNTSLIWLVVTNGPTLPKTDVWAGGVNANWDASTLNWTSNGVPITYAEGDIVRFDDSATTGTVALTGPSPHTPAAWWVTNNQLNYTFTGPNHLASLTGLSKGGAGSVTLAESGDSFTGGITVNGGTVILDEPTGAISGGLTIATNATAQVGNNDPNGILPGGVILNNGSLIVSQSITNTVAIGISGNGSLTQNGSGTLVLSGGNTFTGGTRVLRGTLALAGSACLPNNSPVVVSGARLDVTSVTAPPQLGPLYLTNAVLNLGATPLAVAGLTLGGTTNTLNCSPASLPPIYVYPTNVTLISSAATINGNNWILGTLPAATPAYHGQLTQTGANVLLTLTNGPLAVVTASLSFSPANPGWPLNPSFCGLSYEKSTLTGHLFVVTNTSLINMFSQIAPAVLRIGGNSVDTTCWGGVSNLTAITAAQVTAFAGFVKALPTNWHVLYGINLSVNNPTNAAAEAAFAANALGSSLLGFEIGNECDLYSGNGLRPASFTYAEFLTEWQTLAGAITNTVPGWAATNGGSGWNLTGPVSADNTSGYTVPFAGNEKGVIALLSQHYYRANGQSSNSTLELLLSPDTGLPGAVTTLVNAATNNHLPYGFRMAECGSFYNGGAPNVSDAYGTALWALDFMATLAENGATGLNFHGGGGGSGYTPIADNGYTVIQARPEFYGLKLFSLLPPGNFFPAGITLSSKINFTAYGVRQTNGGICALLNNKDTTNAVQVTLNLGPAVTAAQLIALTGTNLNSTNAYTLGGAPINPDGSWAGGVQAVVPATNGQLTVTLPPISGLLLIPVLTGGPLACHLSGHQITLSWATNYLGWTLQSNAVSLLTGTAWFPVPGSPATNRLSLNLTPGETNVFYRLLAP